MESTNSNEEGFTDIPKKKENEEIVSSEHIENDILEKYDIFSNVYTSSDNSSFVDSEEDTSSKNLGFYK
ncbi:conserved Plasmodium protein, unknown function [Plasmodium malariae]|uniref:Uncharacterized protein n=1 Tax=Plasmodium malariae TaxID=5858 RepID=A0A1A8WAE3_PLAMA|nr:hypothetical protein PMALA_028120 [Plasmodium malariae]SBT72584.1 conserved Plasmodium protein, unknown function [Plasmodium malariae]